ncbi:Uncharacterised protein [Mycobacteroides abscessus subsp. abscessus]|nr:Uncharacterised protein [Mycobacteroides abscessus subsp. abscessus]
MFGRQCRCRLGIVVCAQLDQLVVMVDGVLAAEKARELAVVDAVNLWVNLVNQLLQQRICRSVDDDAV